MIEFFYHEGIKKEIGSIEKKFSTLRNGFSSFEKLCQVQFDPYNPQQIIAPAKLHRVTQNDIWTMWKVELVVPNAGLRPNQYPRVWFAVKGVMVVFLCMKSHIDNYDDGKMNNMAMSRVTDFF